MDNLSGLMENILNILNARVREFYCVKGQGMKGLIERMEISRVVRSI